MKTALCSQQNQVEYTFQMPAAVDDALYQLGKRMVVKDAAVEKSAWIGKTLLLFALANLDHIEPVMENQFRYCQAEQLNEWNYLTGKIALKLKGKGSIYKIRRRKGSSK